MRSFLLIALLTCIAAPIVAQETPTASAEDKAAAQVLLLRDQNWLLKKQNVEYQLEKEQQQLQADVTAFIEAQRAKQHATKDQVLNWDTLRFEDKKAPAK